MTHPLQLLLASQLGLAVVVPVVVPAQLSKPVGEDDLVVVVVVVGDVPPQLLQVVNDAVDPLVIVASLVLPEQRGDGGSVPVLHLVLEALVELLEAGAGVLLALLEEISAGGGHGLRLRLRVVMVVVAMVVQRLRRGRPSSEGGHYGDGGNGSAAHLVAWVRLRRLRLGAVTSVTSITWRRGGGGELQHVFRLLVV